MENQCKRDFLPSFGRRRARTLKGRKPDNLDRYLISFTEGEGQKINIKDIFPGSSISEYWIEIGFGAGEHTAAQALYNPDIGIIGAEPFMDGVESLAYEIEDKNIKNIRIFSDDVRLLLKRLPDNIFNRIFILFPDPWPKKRHHKRRIINHNTFDILKKKSVSGAQLRIATDHYEYAEWINETLESYKDISYTILNSQPKDWIVTRYNQKAIEQKKSINIFEAEFI